VDDLEKSDELIVLKKRLNGKRLKTGDRGGKEFRRRT
jgi:hypothetical protein